jgi:RNA methyltransferase, TrmH family
MLSKSEKIWIKSLKDKKTRYQRKEFVAEGSKLVIDLIKARPDHLQLICCTKTWLDDNPEIDAKYQNAIRTVTASVLHSISSLKSTEEVLAVFSFPVFNENQESDESGMIVFLDKIRDPGNLGTVLRTADWFGITSVYCSPDTVDAFNNKSIQATMSSIMRVQLIPVSWQEFKHRFSNIPIYAACSDGLPIYECNRGGVKIICIGNESNGLSEEILQDCNVKIAIPGNKSLGAESLNAAVAASLIIAWNSYG